MAIQSRDTTIITVVRKTRFKLRVGIIIGTILQMEDQSFVIIVRGRIMLQRIGAEEVTRVKKWQ